MVLMSDATAGCYWYCACLDDLTRTLEVVQNQVSLGGSVIRVKRDGAGGDPGALGFLGIDPGLPINLPGMAVPASHPRQAGSGTGTWAIPEGGSGRWGWVMGVVMGASGGGGRGGV